METDELRRILEEYGRLLQERVGERQRPWRVVHVNGNPVLIVGVHHLVGTVYKGLRVWAPRLLRKVQEIAKALAKKDTG